MEGIKGNNDEDMSNGEMNAIESDSDDDTKFWVRNGKEIQASPKKAVASEKGKRHSPTRLRDFLCEENRDPVGFEA